MMVTKAWRFITLLLASLSAGMAFCHLLEMPPRLGWDASLWVGATVIGNVFRLFGSVGAVIETGAIIAAVALAFVVRRHAPATRILSIGGASLLILAMGVWWGFVFPVNAEMATWGADTVPADWAEYRLRWESAHAARAIILIAGFCALMLSVIIETSSESRAKVRNEPPPGSS